MILFPGCHVCGRDCRGYLSAFICDCQRMYCNEICLGETCPVLVGYSDISLLHFFPFDSQLGMTAIPACRDCRWNFNGKLFRGVRKGRLTDDLYGCPTSDGDQWIYTRKFHGIIPYDLINQKMLLLKHLKQKLACRKIENWWFDIYWSPNTLFGSRRVKNLSSSWNQFKEIWKC